MSDERTVDQWLGMAIVKLPPMAWESHMLIEAARLAIRGVAEEIEKGERDGWRCESMNHGEIAARLWIRG